LGVDGEQGLTTLAGDTDDEVVWSERTRGLAGHRERQGNHVRQAAVDGQAAHRCIGEWIGAALYVDQTQRVADLGDGQPVGARGDEVGDIGDVVDALQRRWGAGIGRQGEQQGRGGCEAEARDGTAASRRHGRTD
jgi:hypothetical protein